MARCPSPLGRSPVRRALAVSLILLGTAAAGQSYDFRIEKLGNPKDGAVGFSASANQNFRSFARQIGAAMTSANLAPPETLGHAGFSVTAELSVVDFRGGGVELPTADTFAGPLLMPSVHLRKGLPWSFELGARAAWIEKSHMGVATAELKWAINEGYRFLPDLGVRAHVSKLLNSRDFDLVAGGVDLGLGKRFAIAGMVTLTPYVGWNLVFVGASTGNVDFNPGATRVEADDPKAQFANLYVFDPLNAKDNAHNRFYVGFRFVAGAFQLGAEMSYSVVGHAAGQQGDQGVWGWNSTLGLDF